MYNGKRILCVIPARGGSKGIPRKNVRLFLGKPLIAWTIKSALTSRYIDKVLVSTEDKKICDIARRYKADVPFLRPKNLAGDAVPMMRVIMHVLSYFEKSRDWYDFLILLQPTSPLRTATDMDRAIEFLFKKNAHAVISVCEVDHSPYWLNVLPRDLSLRRFLKPGIENKRRQELPVFYRINGAIYLADTRFLKKKKSFFGNRSFAYITSKENSVDIDTEFDFRVAESIAKINKPRVYAEKY